MIPRKDLIKLKDNEQQIKLFLQEVVLQPRKNAIKWSIITKQTPNIKIGYPGQHLASLITGIEGQRTGARGNDLADGSEVKSCSRIDQLDKCLTCKYPVARLETVCSNCGSRKIKRNNDSKWLFTIRSLEDLKVLTELERVILILGDYLDFENNDFDTLRFQCYEIWPKSTRNKNFVQIMTNYYNKLYLEHKKFRPNITPAPKNFWPYQYQFYMCNPIRTFTAIVRYANTEPEIEITDYVLPAVDRSTIKSEIMPVEILNRYELDVVIQTQYEHDNSFFGTTNIRELLDMDFENKRLLFPEGVNENQRANLKLRDTDNISVAKDSYTRRAI